MQHSPRDLTVYEVAEALRVSVRTIHRHIDAGNLEAIDVGHGTRHIYRISPDALDAFRALQKSGGVDSQIDVCSTGKDASGVD